MKTSILIGFVILFSAIIIYYLHERIVYLEKSVSKQNEVLSDFISNVQKQVCSVPPSHHQSLDNTRDNIKVINNEMDVNPFEKIVISDDEDSDDDDDSDSDESDTSDEDDSDDENEVRGGGDRNIKVIELVDNDKDRVKENDTEKENDLKEMHDDELSCSSDNVKKIELSKETDDGTASSFASDIDLKKLSVGELRNLIVSKGNVSAQNASKMKKQELIEALALLK